MIYYSAYEAEAARFSPGDDVAVVFWQFSIVKERVVSSALFDFQGALRRGELRIAQDELEVYR